MIWNCPLEEGSPSCQTIDTSYFIIQSPTSEKLTVGVAAAEGAVVVVAVQGLVLVVVAPTLAAHLDPTDLVVGTDQAGRPRSLRILYSF